MSSGVDLFRRRAERRLTRLAPVLNEPIRDARVDAIDRVPLAVLLLSVLAASTLIHVAALVGASATGRRLEVRPATSVEIRVALVEDPAPAPRPGPFALLARTAAPTPRKRMPRTAAPPAAAPPPAQPVPPAQQNPPPSPSPKTPPVSNPPPLLVPRVSVSATTAAGGLAVRTGKGVGGAPSSPGASHASSRGEPGRGKDKEIVPGNALTEEPIFLDNLSAAEIRKFYPEEARRAELEGAVRTKLLVDEEGAVVRATLVSDPSGAFGRAAIRLARLYRFKPARIGNRAVATEIEFTIQFELD